MELALCSPVPFKALRSAWHCTPECWQHWHGQSRAALPCSPCSLSQALISLPLLSGDGKAGSAPAEPACAQQELTGSAKGWCHGVLEQAGAHSTHSNKAAARSSVPASMF